MAGNRKKGSPRQNGKKPGVSDGDRQGERVDLRRIHGAPGRRTPPLRNHRRRTDRASAPNTRHQEVSGNLSRIVSPFMHLNPGRGKVFSAPTDVFLPRSAPGGRTGSGGCLERTPFPHRREEHRRGSGTSGGYPLRRDEKTGPPGEVLLLRTLRGLRVLDRRPGVANRPGLPALSPAQKTPLLSNSAGTTLSRLPPSPASWSSSPRLFPSWVIPSYRRSGLFPPPEEPSPPWRDRSIPTGTRTPKTNPCRAHLSFPALKGEVCRAIGSMPVRLTKRPERTRKRRHSCLFLSVHQTPGARVFFFRSFFCWDDRRERGKAGAP